MSVRSGKPRLASEFLRPFCVNGERNLVVLLLEVPIEGLIVYLGSLGDYRFRQTMYAYVGADFEENYKKIEKSLWRWRKSHIEYFLSNPFIRVVGRCCKKADGQMTVHNLAGRLRWYGVAVKGFEVYDCHCESHLIRVEDRYGMTEELERLGFTCYFNERALEGVGGEVLEFLKRRMKNAEKMYGDLFRQYVASSERNDLSV